MLKRKLLNLNPLSSRPMPRPPFWMVAGFLTVVTLSWVPLVLFARARVTPSDRTAVHLFQDMGIQPRYQPQQTSPVFADGRAMRPRIAGTVARGQLAEDDHYERGFALSRDAAGKTQAVFFEGFPKQLTLTPELLRRGQERFNIYCAACHGYDGYGNGTVNARATELGEPKWVPATSMHGDQVRSRPEGHLYNTINNGIRNMPGYGAQIPVQDRWAIVAYIRALQLSQNAPADVLPPEKRETLR